MFSRYLDTDIFKSLENEFYGYRKCMYIYVKKNIYIYVINHNCNQNMINSKSHSMFKNT